MLMRDIVRSVRIGRLRKVMFVLIAAMGIIGVLPQGSGAAVIPADEVISTDALRSENTAKVRAMLEREEVAARLADFGLTPEEVGARMDELTDEQVAELAAEADRINEGGDALGSILVLALVILFILLILHLLGYIDMKLPKRD